MRNSSGFDAFYAASAAGLIRHVYLGTGDLGRAQDCVQEAYLRAWQRWSQLGVDGDDPIAWVRTVAWRLAVDDWRRSRRLARALIRRGPDTDVVQPSENVTLMAGALSQISIDQRAVIVLHYFDDLPVNQIANVLGVPEGTVKARLSRGRTALAAVLKPEELKS